MYPDRVKTPMTVGEIIEKLKHLDPDIEVFVAPVIAMPSGGNLNVDKGTLTPSAETFRIPSPFVRFPVEVMQLGRDLEDPNNRQQRVTLGYTPDVEEPPSEFVS